MNKSKFLIMIVLLVLIVIAFIASLFFGVQTLSIEEVYDEIIDEGPFHFILYEYRLPRSILAVVVGAALALSGVLVQSVIRNPLASPEILGINNAASLMAIIALTFIPFLSVYWLPVFAFAGGILAFVLLWVVCGYNFSPLKMALVGVALSAFYSSVSLYIMLSNPLEINNAMLWMTGSLWGRGWSFVAIAVPWLLILLPLGLFFCKDLDTMGLGENKASSLGVNITKVQILVLLIAVGLASTGVAVCGPIAFLGLVAPHLARKMIGGRHIALVPTAMLIGALLLQVSDLLARVIAPPLELPAGILTAIIGAPYFFWLLIRMR